MTTKSVIYEPTGRAGEYSELALNLYTGCPNGCKYCYVPDVLHMPAEEFHKKAVPRLELKDIEESASKFYGDTRSILLNFTCDPYPKAGGNQFTRDAITILKSRGLRVNVLTKNGIAAGRDFDLLVPGQDRFSTTLTCILSTDSTEWEPKADLPGERIMALRAAHQMGIETWVSLEPVLNPEWSIKLMEMTRGFVDHYKVGKLNYHALGNQINWKTFGWKIKNRMDELGVKYYLKKDLIQEMGIQ
jgi:DNA repair photolyase